MQLDKFFETVAGLGTAGQVLANSFQFKLGIELMKAIMTPELPKELMVAYWRALANLLHCDNATECRVVDEDSGQVKVGQAAAGTMVPIGELVLSINSQVALGDANVHVDAVDL